MTATRFVIRRSRRNNDPPEGPFEYRVWPRMSHPAVPRLQRGWPLVSAERRTDIYLLNGDSDRMLTKQRNGERLEIKVRSADVGSVRHWSMPVSTHFPLDAAQRADLARALRFRDGLGAEAGLSPAHLLAALSAREPGGAAQSVRKSRLSFQRRNCTAEICRGAVAGWAGLTVALESPDDGDCLCDRRSEPRAVAKSILRRGIRRSGRHAGAPSPHPLAPLTPEQGDIHETA